MLSTIQPVNPSNDAEGASNRQIYSINSTYNNNIATAYGDPVTAYSSVPGFELTPVGRWQSPFFCCFTQILPSCLMSFMCACVMAGQISEKLGWKRCGWVVSIYVFAIFISILLSSVIPWLILVIFLWIALFYIAWAIRFRARRLFSIPGDIFTDCLISAFCTCCTISQVARHVYGYRGIIDGCTCSTHGTPVWQEHIQREIGFSVATSLPVSYTTAVSAPITVQPSTYINNSHCDNVERDGDHPIAVAIHVAEPTTVQGIKYSQPY